MKDIYTDTEVYSIPELDSSTITQAGNSSADKLIILDTADHEKHKELFENIKKAMKLGSDKDFQLITVSENSPCPINQIPNIEVKKLIVCFGITPDKVSLKHDLRFNILHRTETYNIVFVGSLEAMNVDKKIKLLFWNAVKDHL